MYCSNSITNLGNANNTNNLGSLYRRLNWYNILAAYVYLRRLFILTLNFAIFTNITSGGCNCQIRLNKISILSCHLSFYMKIFKHKHCILKWKCNIAIMKESQIIKSFHIFCALFCNMRIGNVKKWNAFLTIPYVSKWNLILRWQVSYIHEIITQKNVWNKRNCKMCYIH